jgi:hypothetical protein
VPDANPAGRHLLRVLGVTGQVSGLSLRMQSQACALSRCENLQAYPGGFYLFDVEEATSLELVGDVGLFEL